MQNRWIQSPTSNPDLVSTLSQELNVQPVVTALLIQRGIDTFDKAKQYFRPELTQLHDPFLMADMDKAVSRLQQAIERKEKILIYGDYDVDGTTSVALAFGYLRKLTDQILYYINDRESEGYGISNQGIDFAIEQKVQLIISLDCGIKAGKLIDRANQNKIDFIVCDHHTVGDTIPNALAVLDPKRRDCNYPFKELSGCGIGFKLLQAFEQNSGEDHDLLEFLDLVSVSIAADIVPLNGENRTLCYFGLQKLNDRNRPGLRALIEISGRRKMDITGILFGIAPRINAAGRIGHAHEALELLLSETQEAATKLAENVNEKNTERRDFDSSITEEALQMIEQNGAYKKSTVLFKEDWHKGVVGIVASRCIEHYYRPTIILTESNGLATGSARSVQGFNIYQAIEKCEHLLEKFGGHNFAAGLSLSVDKVSEFAWIFEEVVENTISEDSLTPFIEIHGELDFDQITTNFKSVIEQMEPFGPENPAPVFMARNVYWKHRPRILKEKHLKFSAIQEGNSTIFDVIGFGLADRLEEISTNPGMSIAFSVETNEYLGVKTIQLRLRDIKTEHHGA